MLNSRRAILATLSGAAVLFVGTLTLAVTVEANSSLTPHYQYLREAVVAGTVMISLGAVILLRRPRHAIGVILLVSGALWFVQALLGELGVAASVFDWAGSSLAAWAANFIRQPGFLLSFALIFHLYPTGAPLGQWGRILIRLAIVGAVLWVLLLALAPGPLEDFPSQPNLFGLQAIESLRQPLELSQVGMVLVGILGGLITIAVRFRRSRGEERAR